ncbi:hypothetical protein GGR54DRAFT_647704 [Hypoxylon sp. NC1633]|nr:hypothetical protein GGR54DRAFT_647704 [Hypoxylon sp. NC1633]
MPPITKVEDLLPSDLSHFTLDGIKLKVYNSHSNKLPKEQMLDTLMTWLHEQVKRDIQQPDMLGFVTLLLTGACQRKEPFTRSEVIAAFKEWQAKFSEEDPANRRRYQIIYEDLQKITGQVQVGPPKTGATKRPLEGREEVGNKYRPEAANRKPQYLRRHRAKKRIEKQNSTRVPARGEILQQTSDSSYGRLKYEDLEPMSSREDTVVDSSRQPPRFFDDLPLNGYMCQRCNSTGHSTPNCPTIAEAGQDKVPAESDYQCEYCKRGLGEHHAELCPNNRVRNSPEELRRGLASQLVTVGNDDRSRYRDPLPSSPTPQRRSRSTMKSHLQSKRYIPYEIPQLEGHMSGRRSELTVDRGNAPMAYGSFFDSYRPTRQAEHPNRAMAPQELPPRPVTPQDLFMRAESPQEPPPRPLKRQKREDVSWGIWNEGMPNDAFVQLLHPISLLNLQQTPTRPHFRLNEPDSDVSMNVEADSEAPEETEQAKREAYALLDAFGRELLSDHARIQPAQSSVVPQPAQSSAVPASDGSNQTDDAMIIDGNGQEIQDPWLQELFKNVDKSEVKRKGNRTTASDMMEQLEGCKHI